MAIDNPFEDPINFSTGAIVTTVADSQVPANTTTPGTAYGHVPGGVVISGFLASDRQCEEPRCDGQRKPTEDLTTRTQHTTALDQSALRDLFAELEITDVPDRICLATKTLCQSQIDAEATAFIGAAPFRAVPEDPSRRPPC